MSLEADLDDILFMHELKYTATLRLETQSLLCNEINSYMEWKLFGGIVRWANALKKGLMQNTSQTQTNMISCLLHCTLMSW